MILNSNACSYLKSIGASEGQVEAVEKYLSILKSQNQNLNLIGRNETDLRISHHHVVDCLLPIELMPKGSLSIADIGSGAGFPGLLWAILMPEKKFLLVEKSPKKCQFLTHTITELQLKNVRVCNSKCSDVTEQVDLIASRAMTSVSDLLNQTEKMQKSKTEWWLLKGLKSSIDHELIEVDSAVWCIDVVELKHPYEDVSRHLVCAKKGR